MRESRSKKTKVKDKKQIIVLNITKTQKRCKGYVPSAFSPPSQLTGSTKEKTKASPP
jgi:hypothetical protein